MTEDLIDQKIKRCQAGTGQQRYDRRRVGRT